ncbi:MAG TPA: immune inhibitor A domain-containing protein [Bacilli bacterium]|nr:immune inhibitor A domain-containing protein [Bacilli bacterium]
MKRTKTALLLLTLLTVVSCQSNAVFLRFEKEVVVKEFLTETTDEYYLPNSYTKSYADILRSNPNAKYKERSLKSTGEQKILVLPVLFPNYPLSNFDESADGSESLINIEKAFFGVPENTSWESVASYYYTSSYGQLLLSGHVAPWYTLPENYATTMLENRVNVSHDKVRETTEIMKLALSNYAHSGGDLTAFDLDEDGYIDSVYVIYGYPYKANSEKSVFWAFAAYNQSNEGTVETPVANMYAWSSYDFLKAEKQKPDAHTYIHEVGHLLGLVDYYNTNYREGYSPLGGFDMMDSTIGDHTGFSKMLLEWTYPKQIKKSATLTLKPFSETGELFLLKNGWNESALDEYLLLEYYTPAALNEQDSRLNAEFKLPRRSGLKVYHVDARTEYKKGNDYVYTSETEHAPNTLEVLAHSNTHGARNGEYKLYSLLEPEESLNILEGGNANMHSLFTSNDDFGLTHFQDFTFNDGTKLDLGFKVKAVNADGITLEFSEI